MGEPFSPEAQSRMREQINLILNDGSVQPATGPMVEVSSRGSHGSTGRVDSPIEINSSPQNVNSPGNVSQPLVPNTLDELNELNVNAETSNQNPTRKSVTWSSIVSENIIKQTPCADDNGEAAITFNDDGSASVNFSMSYLVRAQKQWETSIVGHFIGGNFAFKFVREQAYKLWQNKGLTGVYYSSKGYYTFRFSTLEERNVALNLTTVQMGGKTLYLMPWMEGSNFKRNVFDKVPCWIRLVDVPYTL